jgi:Tfp pilus assembly protein PilO
MRPQAATFLRRNFFAFGCTVIILTLVGVGWWLWHDLGVQEETLHVRTLQGEVELETIATSPLLREALNQAHTAVTRIEGNLAVENNLADNLGYFYQLEEKTRARIRGLNQLTTSGPADGDRAIYKPIPYTMEVSGTYAQVMDFLQSIESGPRLVKVRSFTFRRADTTSGNVLLQLDLVVLGKA